MDVWQVIFDKQKVQQGLEINKKSVTHIACFFFLFPNLTWKQQVLVPKQMSIFQSSFFNSNIFDVTCLFTVSKQKREHLGIWR